MSFEQYSGHQPNLENDDRSSEDFDYDLVDDHLSGCSEEEIIEHRQIHRSPRAEFCTQALIYIKEDKRSRVALTTLFLLFSVETIAGVSLKYNLTALDVRNRLSKFLLLVGDDIMRQLDDADRGFVLRILRYISNGQKAKLTVDCIFIAMNGEQIGGVTMAAIARQHGLTTQLVSKKVQQVQADLYLPPCRYNKTETARKSYAKYNWRPCRAPE